VRMGKIVHFCANCPSIK